VHDADRDEGRGFQLAHARRRKIKRWVETVAFSRQARAVALTTGAAPIAWQLDPTGYPAPIPV
jgi:hypothetical protein